MSKQRLEKKTVHFTLADGSTTSRAVTSADSIPTHNKNGLRPDITPKQMMDLCMDEIHKALQTEQVGMTHDLVDTVIQKMDVVPAFAYRQISDYMERDGRFNVFHGHICSLEGTNPVELMAEKLK